MFDLRQARPSDAERLAAYHHECWLEAFTPLLPETLIAEAAPDVELFADRLAPNSGFTTVVATDEADIAVGHVTVKDALLVHLFVEPRLQNRGIGGVLLARGERIINTAGHVVAELHTRVGNDAAIRLYLANGWEMTDGMVHDPLPGGRTQPEHVMTKRFHP